MAELDDLWAAFDQGDYAAVKSLAKPLLQAQPGRPNVLQLLAAAEFESGDDLAAVASYQALVAIDRARPEPWLGLATAQRAAGEWTAAAQSFLSAAERGADDAAFHLNYGLLLLDLLKIDEASPHLSRAYELAPNDARVALTYARLCSASVRQEAALAVLARWRHWPALAEVQLAELSHLFLQLGEMAEAEAVLKLALMIDPTNALSSLRHAGLLERLNRLDDAEAALNALPSFVSDRELAFEQQAVSARLAQRRGRHAEAAAAYQALLQLPEARHEEQELCFALAKSLDALGQYDAAMAALQRAHAEQTRLLSLYTPDAARQADAFRIANFSADAQDFSQWSAQGSDAEPQDPLFVVAFPRSGTTLLEQMLDAHPALCSMDEQPFLQLAISDMEAAGAIYPEQLASLTTPQLNEIRQAYWARVATKVQVRPGVRLVDKNPLNMLRLPAIRRVFPKAQVLLMVRHPCDVVLSCAMQNFRAPEFALLCRDLPSLAAGYAKAFDFYYAQQALLGVPVLELRYEALVADVEGAARSICTFAKLPWHDAMLDPARHAQARGYISTPSYSQVIKPVNSNAVDRWQHYAAYFADALPLLRPHMTRWGYES